MSIIPVDAETAGVQRNSWRQRKFKSNLFTTPRSPQNEVDGTLAGSKWVDELLAPKPDS